MKLPAVLAIQKDTAEIVLVGKSYHIYHQGKYKGKKQVKEIYFNEKNDWCVEFFYEDSELSIVWYPLNEVFTDKYHKEKYNCSLEQIL